MGTRIKFKAVKIAKAFSRAGKSCHGQLIHNKTLGMDEIATEFAQYAHLDETEARYRASQFANFVVKALGEGKRLKFDAFSLYLTMTGTIDGANGAFTPGRNAVEANIRAFEPLENALRRLEPVNATMADEKLRITSVLGAERKEEGWIASGETILVAGGTFIIDTTREDEGVWLETMRGKRLMQARVLQSTATTLDVVFDDEIAPGKYRLAVYTRLGDADRPSSAVARRIVNA